MSLQDDIFDVQAALGRRRVLVHKAFDRLMIHMNSLEQEVAESRVKLADIRRGLKTLIELGKGD